MIRQSHFTNPASSPPPSSRKGGVSSTTEIETSTVPLETPTFAKLPAAGLDALQGTRVVVMGASEASPYKSGVSSHAAQAPAALRVASAAFASRLAHFDFDLGATLFPDAKDRRGMVDAGDVRTSSTDAAGNRQRIEAAVRSILEAGAVPVVLGGDDSVPIPVLAAYENHGPLFILQIDAHVDWADVVQGNALGYGSTMRRASEYPWVKGMVQVGIRGLGSGVAGQHDDARAWGSQLITSYQFHAEGLDCVLKHLPENARVFVSLDCDGLDPSVLPAVNAPTPGGLRYEDIITLLREVAAKAEIAGLALVEYVPDRDDAHQLSALTAARIVAVTMGLAVS